MLCCCAEQRTIYLYKSEWTVACATDGKLTIQIDCARCVIAAIQQNDTGGRHGRCSSDGWMDGLTGCQMGRFCDGGDFPERVSSDK